MLIRKNSGPSTFQPIVGKIIGTSWVEVPDGLAKKLIEANPGYSAKPSEKKIVVESSIDEELPIDLVDEDDEDENDFIDEEKINTFRSAFEDSDEEDE